MSGFRLLSDFSAAAAKRSSAMPRASGAWMMVGGDFYPPDPIEPVPKMSRWKLAALAVTAGAAVCYLTRRVWTDQRFRTWCLSKLSRSHSTDVATVRGTFTSMPLSEQSEIKETHSHPRSAEVRARAVVDCQRACSLIGTKPFMFQMSSNDVKHGRDGSSLTYWAKDLTTPPSYAVPVEQTHAIVMVDVDEYVDMHEMLVDHFQPYLLYTFQPSAACHSTGEYSFCFQKDGSVLYQVSGGARYHHHVWNWSMDTVLVQKRFGPLVIGAAVYNVTRRRYDDHHELVLLSPMRHWSIGGAWTTTWLKGDALTRLNPVAGEFVRLDVQTNEGLMRSTGMVGGHVVATVPASTDDQIGLMSKTASAVLSASTVETNIKGGRSAAVVLTHYHRQQNAHPGPTIFPVEEGVLHYQVGKSQMPDDARKTMHPFMPPLIVGKCWAPLDTKVNEEFMIQQRLETIKTRATTITASESRYMHDFARGVFPDAVAHTFVPCSVEDVKLRQDRPSQRRLIEQAEATGRPKRIIKSFMKAESYEGPKPPRIISTFDPKDKLDYAQFVYPMADYAHTYDWYAFGKTPAATAATVSTVCTNARHVVPGDFSKFDGRVGNKLRELEVILQTRCFRPEYISQCLAAHAAHMRQRGIGKHGTEYEQEDSRGSGEMATAYMNTLLNKYLAYATFRACGMTHEEAFGMAGIYGGDDSLTADIDLTTYVSTCASYGQLLDAVVLPRMAPQVPFLARIYSPAVWCGSPNSMCDLPRTLNKLHATHACPDSVLPDVKFVEKMRGLTLTDSHTPVIRNIVGALKRILTPQVFEAVEDKNGLFSWWAKYPPQEQYPNENEQDWMDHEVALDMPQFDMWTLVSHCEQAADLAALMRFPLCVDHEAPLPKMKWTYVVNSCVVWNEHGPVAFLGDRSETPSYHTTRSSYSPSSPTNTEAKALVGHSTTGAGARSALVSVQNRVTQHAVARAAEAVDVVQPTAQTAYAAATIAAAAVPVPAASVSGSPSPLLSRVQDVFTAATRGSSQPHQPKAPNATRIARDRARAAQHRAGIPAVKAVTTDQDVQVAGTPAKAVVNISVAAASSPVVSRTDTLAQACSSNGRA